MVIIMILSLYLRSDYASRLVWPECPVYKLSWWLTPIITAWCLVTVLFVITDPAPVCNLFVLDDLSVLCVYVYTYDVGSLSTMVGMYFVESIM